MDPSLFYGSSKHVNTIPGDGVLSDDDLDSDSDPNYEPNSHRARPKKNIIIPESESDCSDNDINPQILQASSTSKKKTKTTKKNKKDKVTWKNEKIEPFDEKNFKFTGSSDLPDEIKKLETPQELFKFLFTDNLIEIIVHQSNLKSVQTNVSKPANITREDIEQFIGIVIFMSCVKLPSTRMYWSKHIGQSQVYETMTCNRFEAVKNNLHFNNNDNFKPRGTDGHDKLFKIRPVLDEIRERLLLVPKEEFLAVDEQIIPTKCRHEIKQYNPAKPHKWGFKNQVLSGVSGFSYDFDIFAGEQSDSFPSDAPNLGVSSNVVTRLTSTVPKHQNYKICFDNWFNSPNLQVYLFQNGLLPLGTVRLNRVPNSDMPTEKELKKNGRGSMVEKTAVIDNVKLSLVSWFDNKTVNMLSAYVGSEPTTTKKSWLLWRRINVNEYLPLFDFKLAISEHMRKAGKVVGKKRGRPASLLGTPTSSRANSTSRVNSPVMAKNFDTPKKT
ncbi:PiggyBac transposable element-derived protein 3 [Eumeta japonica]|uniref:PiggyBac transposable element-derived protein 3 n=1 Tax=Eumeta variegata TaxID=151549 RepID=A0A4C1YJS6_EUMVA|nr:PiggyBac transposable element-derived protein 3 [Eumeta japonica]